MPWLTETPVPREMVRQWYEMQAAAAQREKERQARLEEWLTEVVEPVEAE